MENDNVLQTEKKSKKDLVLIVFLIIIILGLVGYILYDKGIITKHNSANDVNNNATKENIPSNNEDKKAEKVNILEKVEPFIKAAMYSDSMGNGMAEVLIKGTNVLTKDNKIMIAYNSLIRIKEESNKVTEVPLKYKNDESYWKEATITSLSIESLIKEYKDFFKEDLNINLVNSENTGCPMFYILDEAEGKLYFSDQCGGTMNPIYLYKTYKSDEDENYYYVYQYVGVQDYSNSGSMEYKNVKSDNVVNVSSFEGNEEKFEKLVWKFDKNFNFVSTENKG